MRAKRRPGALRGAGDRQSTDCAMNWNKAIGWAWQAPQGRLGIVLLAICWPLNWMLPGMRTAYLFFPLWLGYVLVVDALVERRTGSSLWVRSRRDFVLLFVESSPVWWIFEVLNNSMENWKCLWSDVF